MSLVVRISVGGILDGVTVPPSIPAAATLPDGSLLVTIPGNLGILPLQLLLDALPGDEPGDVFFPRIEWAGGAVNSLNVLGPGLAAVGPSRALVSGAVNAVFVAELGGLRFVSDGAGPFQIETNLVYTIHQSDMIRAACCQADLEAGGGGGVPSSSDFVQEFGVFSLAGAGANPRFLWPGGGRTGTAQPQEVGATIPYACTLDVLAVRQGRPPGVGAAMLTYDILLEGAPVAASVVLPVTSSAVSLVSGLGIAILAGQRLSCRVARDVNHASVLDVFATVGLNKP